jgi:RNA polymerase sigma factor (sigma-70 family)
MEVAMGTSPVSVQAVDHDQLVRRAQNAGFDGEAAQLELLNAHEHLFQAAIGGARRYGLLRTKEQRDDAEQSARLGFLEALARYDVNRGVTLATFARPFVTGAVFQTLKGDARYWNNTEPLPTDTSFDDNDYMKRLDPALTILPDSSAEEAEVAAAVGRFANEEIPARQQYVVKQIFWKDRRQADVARELGVTRMAINDMVKRVTIRGRVSLGQLVLK